MTTALEIMTDAAQDAGIIASNETLDATDGQKCFRLLQRMLDGDSTEDLMIFNNVPEVFALTNQQMYTMGPTGDWVTTRPVDVTGVYMRDTNGNDLECQMLDYEQYADILSKEVSATIALGCWYNASVPNSELWFWPIPEGTTYRAVVWSWKRLAELTAINDTIVFPPGYEDYIEWNLAEKICAAFTIPVPAIVSKFAADTKGKLKKINVNVPLLSLPADLAGGQTNNTFPISPHVLTGY